MYRSSMSLPRSSSSRSRASFKFSSLKYMIPEKILRKSSKNVDCDNNSDNNSGSPDSELDSGISINGHYDHIDHLRKNRLDYDRIEEIKTMTGRLKSSSIMIEGFVTFLFSEEMTLNLINRVEHQRKEPPPISGILKKYYRGTYVFITKNKKNLLPHQTHSWKTFSKCWYVNSNLLLRWEDFQNNES